MRAQKSLGELSMNSRVRYPVQFVLSAGRDCLAVSVLALNALNGSIERFAWLLSSSDSKKCHLDFALVETALSTAL